jgi:hypothetical protein
MTKLLQKLALGLAGLAVGVVCAQAQPLITGEISFSGGATLNGLLNNATAFTSIFGPGGPGTGDPLVNSGATGSYASVPVGTPVSFTPFTFNPAPVSPFQLWSFSNGSSTYSFEVTSVVISRQLPTFLNIQGNGVAYITGHTPTLGTWGITDTGSAGPVFSFGNVTMVPEPTAALLFVFGSIALIARKRVF